MLKIPEDAFLHFSEEQMIKNLPSNFYGFVAGNMNSDDQNIIQCAIIPSQICLSQKFCIFENYLHLNNPTFLNSIIKSYLSTIKEICPNISNDALILFGNKLEIFELQPKDILIQAELLQKSIGYIHSGLIRAFYINEKGEDITINFVDEKKLVVHLDALSNNKPSKFNFQALEKTTIINIPKEHIDFCSEKYPLLEKYRRVMIEQVYCRMFNRLEAFLIDNTEERYLNFMGEFPTLFNRIPISHLCTYLGVKRQTLTRIRKKIMVC